MMNKITTKYFIVILFFTMLIGCITSSPITAYAATDPVKLAGELSGNEDASNIDEFDGNLTVQNIFKFWSMFKSLGYSDEQAAGAMGCMQAECTFHTEMVETNSRSGDSIDDYNDYVEKYSSKFTDDHDAMTVEALKRYNSKYPGAGDAATIAAARQEKDITNNGLHEPTYFVDGQGYCGIGFNQFTGEGAQQLIEWAKKNNVDWYNIDNQMIWSMTNVDDGGYSRYKVWTEYISATKGQGVDDCTHWYATNMINGNFKNPSGDMVKMLNDRINYAQAIYKAMHGKSWDSTYGDSIVSGAGLQPSAAKNGINDQSILFSLVSNVVIYPENTGFLLSSDNSANSKNLKVYKGYIKSLQGKEDTSQKYSLYELFGEDLHWYRYLGELTYAPQLLDHIWSAVEQNRIDKLIGIDTINYEAKNYLSCHVYEDRPNVLTNEDIDNGYSDPRVLSLNNSWFNGYTYVLGSIELTVSKYLVALMSALMGHEILDKAVDIITALEQTEIFKVIKTPILLFVGFAMIAFIFSLVGKAKQYAEGRKSAKEVIARFLVGVACLGMIFAGIERPDVFNNLIVKSLTIVDQLFEASLSKSVEGDEVIDVQDDDMIVQAAIWKTAIFNAWCRGQFDGREYNKLYTNASGKSKSKWMPMSRETGPEENTIGKPYYNTSNAVHEELVVVPIGGNTLVYNWAAYLYSCGSKYHIDSSLNAETAKSINLSNTKLSFPMAKTTANNSKLYADTFRVIDAQMDISPQLYDNGSISNNYTNAHMLNTKYTSEGAKMLFNTALLAFMIPLVFKKLMSFMLMLITSLKMIYFTLLELFKEKSGWDDFLQSIKKNFMDYFVSSLKINIMVVLYMKFVDKGLFMTILYIILCIVILGFTWDDAKRKIYDVKHTISKAKNMI